MDTSREEFRKKIKYKGKKAVVNIKKTVASVVKKEKKEKNKELIK